ncbi:MAG TPA: hypothetical protein VN858_00995 [Casimicrobiaceae bacterium]|nr:hypothetical protein [Casimicrobiaceae bacterium]
MTDPSIEIASGNKLLAMLSPATTNRIVARMDDAIKAVEREHP